ncbi:MAG: putative bifunctional diguanylate cyclase/phosphodiesterase [Hyphomicrobiaceae bacterium]
MAQGLVVYNDRSELVLHNATYRAIYGLKAEDLRDGLPIQDVIQLQAKSLGLSDVEVKEFAIPFANQAVRSWSAVRKLPDGRSIHMSRRQMGAGHFVVTHQDISDRVRMEDEIRYTANHDNLTGLANRMSFLQQLETLLTRVRRGDRIALLAIDLDNFKQVNDTHGHAIGDELLKQVAMRLQQTIRDTDVVARFGGDEFAIIQVPGFQADSAERLARRVIEALATPYLVNDLTLFVGASVGIALADEHTANCATLMHNSDLALYRAKQDGRGVVRFFDDHFDKVMRRKREMEVKMRRALVLDQFTLHYQPILNIERERVESVEALLRWQDGDDWISPGDFIPLAEENGLIIPIGEWVMRRACLDATKWPEHISIAVNVSPLQFKTGNLVQSIQDALAASNLNPARLRVEITESVLLDDSTDVLSILNKLHDLGVQIALDDFGTGYSSLKYLTSFPFNKIKIDRSFVTGLPAAFEKLAVIRAATALGRDLGMETVVEGVETPGQLQAVRAAGCNHVQGFFFAKPKPLDALAATVEMAENLCKTTARPQFLSAFSNMTSAALRRWRYGSAELLKP